MTEQPPSQIGTVAQEAARLIEDMATMARSTYSRGNDSSPYAGEPAEEPVWPHTPDPACAARQVPQPAHRHTGWSHCRGCRSSEPSWPCPRSTALPPGRRCRSGTGVAQSFRGHTLSLAYGPQFLVGNEPHPKGRVTHHRAGNDTPAQDTG